MTRITKKYMKSIGFSVKDTKNGWMASLEGCDCCMFRRMIAPRYWIFSYKTGSCERAVKSTHLTVEQLESITKTFNIGLWDRKK